ncbi:hypothetical protein C8A03DRAFT_19825 [Achaetomium macrosporum]|uniref:Uncharacterized protein n=1 Tax=Achaetomium macrosporum TaxID=79813 RepID=A0AAN7C0J2_9PEZI|nr:hypothetical protein C8A03DRAFT_19825 [Achaetomium macrosporum]
MTALRLAIQEKNRDLIGTLLEYKAYAKDIPAKDWLNAYEKEATDIVLLSEGSDEVVRVCFPTADELSQASAETERRLFVFEDDSLWPRVPITNSIERLKPNTLLTSLPKETDGHSIDVSFSLSIPVEQYPTSKHFSIPDGRKCRIAWKIIRPTHSRNDPWRPIVYFSMLPNGWIPHDGIDFFKQFIVYLKERWLELCRQAEEHLTQSRLDQLRSEGKSPELMHRLAKDAQTWAELRDTLQGQVCEADKFFTSYCQRYNANRIPNDLELLIDRFESDVSDRIRGLDQTVKDLLQIEFAWASITETRISTRLGQNFMLLTYVSIFYLPLAFCAALWAIPDIAESSTRNPFIITSTIVGLITLFVAFNLENITRSIGKVYHGWREKLVGDMRNDDRWKEKGEELQNSILPGGHHLSGGFWDTWYID